jgi:hypothetical protein
MSPGLKKIVKLLVKIAITAVLLVWVLAKVDFSQFGEGLSNARWGMVGWVWGLNLVSFWILSYSMHLILKRQECDASTRLLFGVSAVTALYGLVLPGLLDVSVKWLILRSHTGKGTRVLCSMAYNQVCVLMVTLFAALAALALTNPTHTWRVPALCVVLMVALVGVFLLAFHPVVGPRITGMFTKLLKPFPAKVRDKGLVVFERLAIFQALPWTFHATILLLNTLAITVVGTLIFISAARAAWINVPIGVLVWQVTLIFLLGRLPISIANLGVREVTLVGTLALYGVGAPAALLMSMIIFSNKLVVAVPPRTAGES